MTDLNPVDAMTTDYRAMCAELAEELVNEYSYCTEWEKGLPLCESNRDASGVVSELLTRARALLAQPMAEAPAEALAARPLLEQVAAMADCIGAHTVGQITAISDRAAAWLRENPPGQPVAIEPRGCPTPGACSCVEPAPVAVSERLPRPEDRTAQGRCWVFYRFFGFAAWTLEKPLGQDGKHTGYTHWLPANALPTPPHTP
jgi:hypothetical protein